jgi:hypothetical protein
LRAQAHHHHAKDHEKGADREEMSEVAIIEEGTGERADEEEQKSLDGTNPSDIGRCLILQQLCLVVGLEDAIRVDDAPAVTLRC